MKFGELMGMGMWMGQASIVNGLNFSQSGGLEITGKDGTVSMEQSQATIGSNAVVKTTSWYGHDGEALPPFFKTAQKLAVRCVLLPAPTVLGTGGRI